MSIQRLFGTSLTIAKLYSTLFEHVQSRPDVAELTVEDPAEAFEDLRDRNDLRYLVRQGVPEDPLLQEGVGSGIRGPRAKWENELRAKHKIAQVSRKTPGGIADPSVNSIVYWRCCCCGHWTRATRKRSKRTGFRSRPGCIGSTMCVPSLRAPLSSFSGFRRRYFHIVTSLSSPADCISPSTSPPLLSKAGHNAGGTT